MCTAYLVNCTDEKNISYNEVYFKIFNFSHPEKFQSRNKNMAFQGLQGGKGMLKRACSSLMEFMTVVCDGIDYTAQLKKLKCSCVLFLNIKSYAGGTRPWKKGDKHFRKPAMDDSLIEVIGLDNLDQAMLQVGGHGVNLCQCKKVVIKTTRAYPMQIDGEPFMIKPCTITITKDTTKAPMAKMLLKDKSSTQLYRNKELEVWAAIKIQRSFRKSKKRKQIK